MDKTALITGITGQDGAYLAQLLLEKGYDVHGMVRQSSTPSCGRLKYLLGERFSELNLHFGDITDTSCIIRILQDVQPDEIYNLAAQSYVYASFDQPEYTGQVDAMGTTRVLESLRLCGLSQKTRYYQASTSEIFGNAPCSPQNEETPFSPCSPYAAAKLYAYWITRNYREAYGMHASNGILFNHESPLRGNEFVSQKIARGVADIHHGRAGHITLGNLEACRDWGHARDYVFGMWQMLQQDFADDYVLATGHTYSVRDFVNAAFAQIGCELRWNGEGVQERAFDAKSGRLRVKISAKLFRPTEVHRLCGDSSKAQKTLQWKPSVKFTDLVSEMIQHACVRHLRKNPLRAVAAKKIS